MSNALFNSIERTVLERILEPIHNSWVKLKSR